MKISKDLEDLFDLESARIANSMPDEEDREAAKEDIDLKGQIFIY